MRTSYYAPAHSATRPTTLIDSLLPGRSLLADAALVVGFAMFTAVFAQIAIKLPFTPVPITGQTLAVLLTGGARWAPTAVLRALGCTCSWAWWACRSSRRRSAMGQ